MEETSGCCLCGKISFKIKGELRGVVACHCSQCRKQSGHYYAATNAPDEAITIEGAEHIKWYQASKEAKRGFCNHCGSALFWKHQKDDFTSILAGSIDEPNTLKMEKHIFCGDKGSYYEITDDLPQSD